MVKLDWTHIEGLKQQATLQLLFRVSRLLNERAVCLVARQSPFKSFRPAHTTLFPHIPVEGIRLVDLAARLGISKQAVFQLVSDLEASGILTRRRDPDDGRCKRICFTEKGVQAIGQGLKGLIALEQALIDEVGSEPMRQLREAVVALTHHLDKQ